MSVPQFSAPLSGWDLATWRLGERDASLRSTVVGIIEISGHPSIELIRSRAKVATELHPVLRCTVEQRSEVPHLVELLELNFNLLVTEHFQITDVKFFAQECAETEFEPQQPLWKLHVVRTQSRTYILAALHHSIADGNGALLLSGYLFDESETVNIHRVEFAESSLVNDQADAFKNSLQPLLNRALKDPAGLVGDISSVVSSLGRLLQLPKSPGSTSMTSRGTDFDVRFYEIQKADVRSLIKGKGVTQHDALVALVLKLLWNFHSQQSQPLKSARINVPVATTVDAAAANRMIVARLECEVDGAKFDELMQRSHQSLSEWRNEPGLALATQLVEASRLIPIDILTTAVKQADATISTLRGVARLGHIDGFRIDAIWPLVAPVGAAVSVTSVGVGQSIFLCISWDKSAISDSQIWNIVLTETFSEILPVGCVRHEFAI